MNQQGIEEGRGILAENPTVERPSPLNQLWPWASHPFLSLCFLICKMGESNLTRCV